MSAWRRIAIETLPEYRATLQVADSPMAAWVELNPGFEEAFRAGNEDLLLRFFAFAEWCLATAPDQPTDASTAAICGFYEHLPLVPGLAEELHRFLPRKRFYQLQEAFRYHTTEAQYIHLRKCFLANLPR